MWPRGGRAALQFYMDMANRRYPLLHTGAPAAAANAAVAALVGGCERRTDRTWLPAALIKRWAAGPHAREQASRTGRLSIMAGMTIQDHLHTVRACRDEYAAIVAGVEGCGMGITERGGPREYGGRPIEITYPRVGDLARLVDAMFRAARPLYLWGIKVKREDDCYGVPAVDLHEGSPIGFEIAPDLMRVYSRRGACGNTILRVFASLQASHGAQCEEIEP